MKLQNLAFILLNSSTFIKCQIATEAETLAKIVVNELDHHPSLLSNTNTAAADHLSNTNTAAAADHLSMANTNTANHDLHIINQKPTRNVMRPVAMEPSDGVTQGKVGACHIFATQTLLKDATGLTVSAARMFLDHLINIGHQSAANPKVLKKAIENLNTDFILDKRVVSAREHCNTRFNDWEFGNIKDNLLMLQKTGGVIVPNNGDWKHIEDLMKQINRERVAQIQQPGPLLRSSRARLNQAGLTSIVNSALSEADLTTSRSIVQDRELVKKVTGELDIHQVQYVGNRELITPHSIARAINSLVKALETRAVYISMNTAKYREILLNSALRKTGGLVAKQGERFPSQGGHAVVICGYSVADDTFFVRDSHFPQVITMKAQDLVQATRYALVFS